MDFINFIFYFINETRNYKKYKKIYTTNMEKSKKYYESFIGNVCEVEWLDAIAGQHEELLKIKDVKPSSLLGPTSTYGVIYSVDDGALIILQEQSEDLCDYTVIPLSWIMKIKELK